MKPKYWMRWMSSTTWESTWWDGLCRVSPWWWMKILRRLWRSWINFGLIDSLHTYKGPGWLISKRSAVFSSKWKSTHERLVQLHVPEASPESYGSCVGVSSRNIDLGPYPWNCIADPESRGLLATEIMENEGMIDLDNSQTGCFYCLSVGQCSNWLTSQLKWDKKTAMKEICNNTAKQFKAKTKIMNERNSLIIILSRKKQSTDSQFWNERWAHIQSHSYSEKNHKHDWEKMQKVKWAQYILNLKDSQNSVRNFLVLKILSAKGRI